MPVEDQIKEMMSQRLRNAIRPEVYLAQRILQKGRQLVGQTGRKPDFLVLGAQKAGTTTLYDLLMRHPDTQSARTKEISYFDRFYSYGDAWYRSNFPKGSALTGEATPCYLYVDAARARIAQDLPQSTRFIVILRNPVDRAISHYFHERRLGYETLDLEGAFAAEPTRINAEASQLLGRPYENRSKGQSFSYINRGLYARQLEAWFSAFPRKNFYVETSDRFFADPDAVMEEVFSHLGLSPVQLPPTRPRNVGVYAGKVPDRVYDQLRSRFAEPNAELAKLLGRELPWQWR